MKIHFDLPPSPRSARTPTALSPFPDPEPTAYCAAASSFNNGKGGKETFTNACLFTGLEAESRLQKDVRECCDSGSGSSSDGGEGMENYHFMDAKSNHARMAYCNITTPGDMRELDFCLWGLLGPTRFVGLDHECWVEESAGNGNGNGSVNVKPMIATTHTAASTTVDVTRNWGAVLVAVVTVDASGVHVGKPTPRLQANNTAGTSLAVTTATSGVKRKPGGGVSVLGMVVFVLLGIGLLGT